MTDRARASHTDIFGVDVHSGDIRGDAPTYALVRLGEDTHERETVSGRKLQREIERHEPAIVATDNVYELAADKDALVHFLQTLPDATRLVQVTGAERPDPLSRVANRHDIQYDSSPMGEAEAAARLAAANVGHVVSAFEDTTTVRVTRGRSPGKGGSSEDRFTRRIHGAVKRRARELTETLESAGIEFEREVTEKYGGWARAVFTVDATPDDLPISAGRSGDVRVEIDRDRTGGLEFEPLVQRRDRVIVGVDPGTNTAVGLVGLEGEVLDVWSSRTSDEGEVINWIIERGRPVIVAADVAGMPTTVDRIRRSFDAVGWVPDDDIPTDEKLHRTREANPANDHERDALAAALFAYDAYADTLERVREKTPPTLEWEQVAAVVLEDDRSIAAAIETLTEEPEPDAEPSVSIDPEPDPQAKRIATLESQVERLQTHLEELEETLTEREDRIEELKRQLKRERTEARRSVRQDREVTRLEREKSQLERTVAERENRIEELEGKVERMKALWRLDHSNFADVKEQRSDLVPVKPIEKFTTGAIEAAEAAYGLAPDDVFYLRDATGAGLEAANAIVEREPRIVLHHGGLSDVARQTLREAEVPLGGADDVAMQEVDELAVARESDVEEQLAQWEERAARRRRERTKALVDELISEHRDE